MAFVVEMFFRGGPEPRSFSCHDKTWHQALELARVHGWLPAGTVPAGVSKQRWEECEQFPADYEPVDWLYIKTVKEEDARALSDALALALDKLHSGEMQPAAKAQPTLLVEGMTQEDFVKANAGITVRFLTEFIAFLRKGAFSFTYDD